MYAPPLADFAPVSHANDSQSDGMANKKLMKPTHHQFSHNAEMIMALAFAFPYVELPPYLMKATFCLLMSGAWLNPIAYWIAAKTGCPIPIFALSPDLHPPLDKSDPLGEKNRGPVELDDPSVKCCQADSIQIKFCHVGKSRV